MTTSSCTEKKPPTASAASDVSDSALRNVAAKRIYFGHQSVGYNIVAGIDDITRAHRASGLNVIESHTPSFTGPAFIHSPVGQNGDPVGKVRDFSERIRTDVHGAADVAIFKFCYIDFNASTDIGQVFETYDRVMTDLENAYPKTRFVRVTVPLKMTTKGWKAQLKSLLGRPNIPAAENGKRHEFNEMVRARYSGKPVLFDLADIEATTPDGRAAFDHVNGVAIPSLFAGYTTDGGHLNESGRRVVAAHLLSYLAGL